MDYIIIVAGGRGTRMGTDVPKQFLPIGGKPVLMHTIERFYDYDHAIGIIVVLPKDQQPTWQTLCERHGFTIPHRVADGGATRFESSNNVGSNRLFSSVGFSKTAVLSQWLRIGKDYHDAILMQYFL